ncbi:solute carrier family 35 member F2-like isoform X1 [Abrus precatorius]|uniref:Solute carrier family 35 member F2-like isoform X1 n=1 Tax=Abrus precatorius TaxID=3816 RepID=A0A8B8L1I0_ABRPR|nr:solute carrier family 35 member F2-like isoform X1 [Abrus precatorius]
MDWLAMRRCSRTSSTFKVLRLLLLGQLVSLSTVFMSLTTSIITQVLGVDAPLTQSLFTYASLALVFGSILLYRRHKPLISWYWYVPLAFADVQGNYLVNKAYQYTSITSVTLLDCWTIPWAIILTWIFLGTRYSLWQLSGASMCVLGLCLVLLSDSWVGGGDGSRPILGDVLVIVGTFFYGTSNVGEEFFVKRKDLVEMVSMLGVFGFLISLVEVSVIELKTLASVKWSVEIVLSFLGYALSSFMFYSIAPFVLKMSGATMFNLSLLTSDMWAVVFRVFLYHQKVDWLYFLAFAIVGIGLVIYSLVEKDSVPAPTTEDDNLDTEYQMIYDESTPSGNDSRG